MPKEKQPKQENFWRKLWDLIKPSHGRVRKIIFSIAVFELVKLSGPYLLKLIIDHLTSSGFKEIMPLLYLVILMFASEQASSLLGYLKDRQIFKMLMDIEYYLPILAGKKLLGLSLKYHEKENTGNKISKIERGIQKITDLVGNISFEVAPTFLQLIATVIVLFIVNIWIGLSFLFFTPLAVFMTYRANQILYPLRKKRHIDYEISVGKITQSIININTVKSFVQEEREMAEYGGIRKMIKENEIKEWFRMLKFNLTRNSFIGLGRITILVLSAFLAWQGDISVGTVIFVITLSEKSYLSLFRLSRFYDRIAEGAEAVSRLVDLINEEIDIKNPSGGLIPKMAKGEVEFKNVTFKYNSGEEKALDNVSVKIPAGCVTALVGPSGGGKTTLARMIYRHYDPRVGEVLFDDVNLRKYDIFAYRRLLAIVPQEVEIFNLTVAQNISYAKPRAGFKELPAAARIAHAEE
jgi:ABC-type multidrug transport system fused ATPase/permease subunit